MADFINSPASPGSASAVIPRSGRTLDRRFYMWASSAAFVVVFAGFARTYYLKFLFGTPPLSSLLELHGALMTAWLALFFAQIRLVASRRVGLHRRLGVFGAGLAVLIVIVVVTVLVHAAIRDVHNPVAGPRSMVFLGTGLVNIAVFATLVSAAVRLRHRRDFHMRLMLLATLGILVAALARLPLGFIARDPLSAAILVTDLCIAFSVAVDTWRHHRLHPAFVWGAALFIISMHSANIAARTPTWMHLATWLVG